MEDQKILDDTEPDTGVPMGTVRFTWCTICGAYTGTVTHRSDQVIDNIDIHIKWHFRNRPANLIKRLFGRYYPKTSS